MSNVFTEISNRDAWSSIRGYVYQVDHTISRWLDIKPLERIELERGEDYDLIDLDNNGQEILRELVQVKHRENNLTLNSDIIIEAIGNYYQHKINNPDINIFFHFVTNTDYGVERPAIFENGVGGIETWIALQKDSAIKHNDKKWNKIRQHLVSKINQEIGNTKPTETAKLAFLNSFAAYLSDANSEQSLPFFKNILWRLSQADHETIALDVKKKIMGSMMTDKGNEDQIYSRLFLFVFKRLCDKGLKFLDKQMLEEQLRLPDLTKKDQQLLANLQSTLTALAGRVESLETKVGQHQNDITGLIKTVSNIELNATFIYDQENLTTDPPALVALGSTRSEKVKAVLSKFQKVNWIAFTGINGTGKTQLAAQICREFQKCFWLDLRPYRDDDSKCRIIIETCLKNISHVQNNGNYEEWVHLSLNQFPEDAILVINDLPETATTSKINALLTHLANSINSRRIKFLTTSNFKIDTGIIEAIDTSLFSGFGDFDFSDEEIDEYLQNHGLNKKLTAILVTVTRRNPRLLTAAINFIKAQVKIGDALEGLLRDEFSDDLTQNVAKAISKQVSDNETRALLYRLSLINWEYTLKEVRALSEVEEKISFPGEKVNSLVDIWIQYSNKTYLNSPLIYSVGRNNLSSRTFKDAHAAIAESILSKKVVDNITAARVINSFLQAEKYDRAGLTLITVYQAAQTAEQAKFAKDWSYLSYWSDQDIPLNMNRTLRAIIRAEQRRIAALTGNKTDYYNQQLAKFLNEDGISLQEKVLIRFSQLAAFDGYDNGFFDQMEFILDNINELTGEGRFPYNQRILSHLAWVPVKQVVTVEALQRWTSLLTRLKENGDDKVLDDEIAENALSVMTRAVVAHEENKPEQERNWNTAKRVLQSLYNFLVANDKPVLAAISLREIISIDFRVLNRKQEAIDIADNALKLFLNKNAVYKITDRAGRLYYGSDPKNSMKWFTEALQTNCEKDLYFPETLIYTASLWSDFNKSVSLQLCERALTIVAANKHFEEIDYVQYMLEAAIAFWENERFNESYQLFCDFIEKLFSLKGNVIPEQFWTKIFSIGGHCLGYISYLVKTGERLEAAKTDYFVPRVGILTTNNKDWNEPHEVLKEPYVFVQLALFAEGIGNLKDANYWATKGFDLARRNGDGKMMALVASTCGQYSLVNTKFKEAFEQILIASLCLTYSNAAGGSSEFEKLTSEQFFRLISDQQSQYRAAALNKLTIVALIPGLIQVATLKWHDIDKYKIERAALMDAITEFNELGADKTFWAEVHHLWSIVSSERPGNTKLQELTDAYKGRNTAFQVVVIIGNILTSNNWDYIIKEVVNIMPFLTDELISVPIYRKEIYYPFVKQICVNAIDGLFVGEKEQLEILKSRITLMAPYQPQVLREMLKLTLEGLSIQPPLERLSWLNGNP